MITQAADKQHCLPDEIRHKFNAGSPQNREYINAFHKHSNELVHIFCVNPEILILWDDLMNEFNTNDISTGKVSKESNDRMKAILDEVYLLASDKLKLTIEKHKFEIDHFPDTMAFMLFSFYFF
jgi:hypothetical protein